MKLILHIPHSSTFFPNLEGFLVDNEVLQKEILKLTDWHTADLFNGTEDIKVEAEFSRIFCDLERFADDEQEVMAQYGMGALYERTDSGIPMRKVSDELRSRILHDYYWKHHLKLSGAVNKQLGQHGKALIIDCHSYSDKPFLRDLNQDSNRPDFCIGTDSFHTPNNLIEESIRFFKAKGYTLGVDVPYSGSIVPMEHYGKDSRVQSIMLEINRKLYLEENSSNKSLGYSDTKKIVTEYLNVIRGKFYNIPTSTIMDAQA